jgi:hypothetical protein
VYLIDRVSPTFKLDVGVNDWSIVNCAFTVNAKGIVQLSQKISLVFSFYFPSSLVISLSQPFFNAFDNDVWLNLPP